jgi:hypothetical protein
MGYRMLTIDHLYEAYRRLVAGKGKRSISIQTGWDRNTNGKYVGILTGSVPPTGIASRLQWLSLRYFIRSPPPKAFAVLTLD